MDLSTQFQNISGKEEMGVKKQGGEPESAVEYQLLDAAVEIHRFFILTP